MKRLRPIKFEGCNANYGDKQEEYHALPAQRFEDDRGTVMFCWSLTWKQRLRLLFTGKVWHMVLTFHKPLQPQFLSIANPITEPHGEEDQ